MATVIVINGSGGVGKSTFIRLCRNFDRRVIELSMVDTVKAVAKYAGWDGTKDDNGRRFLSDLKDAMDRYGDLPMTHTIGRIRANPGKIVFVNAREPKDISRLVSEFGAKTLLITRDCVLPVTSNHADAGVNDYDYDCVINNNGSLGDLTQAAKKFLEGI